MAKQVGAIQVSGTLDNLTFFTLDGTAYVRKKTSLDKKRVMKDAAFENSRKCMKSFGASSKFCSQVYRFFPKDKKGQGIQQKMTGRAQVLFREGKTEAEVKIILVKEFG